MHVERKHAKYKNAEPSPVILKLEKSCDDVDNGHTGDAVAHVIEIVGAEGECLQSNCLFFVSNVQDLM